ncbi:MAG: HDIG domain-containing protein [Spirochaetes bacterium]|nr:HDIG domain-containing protein [Spirochaetota bacterium]MBU0954331.1 HDIG domain-containing protein [Spirochaetota bacterium]
MNQSDNGGGSQSAPKNGQHRNFSFRHMWEQLFDRFRSFLSRAGLGNAALSLSILAALLLCIGLFIVFAGISHYSVSDVFEVGKVADRDIVASHDIVYVDEAATALRVDLERRRVPAVFVLDDLLTARTLQSLRDFAAFFTEQREKLSDNDAFQALLHERFPGLLPVDLLQRLIEYSSPAAVFRHAESLLEAALLRGILSVPEHGLEPYNPQLIELRSWKNGSLVYEQLDYESILTIYMVPDHFSSSLRRQGLTGVISSLVADLAGVFVSANTFFDEALSLKRLEAAGAAVEPVMKRLEQGERVIRKGFVVTEQDLLRLQALQKTGSQISFPYVLGGSAYIMLLFLVSLFFFSRRMIGTTLTGKSFFLVLALAVTYFVLAAVLSALLPLSMQTHLGALLPGALFAMLLAILVNERCAILFTLILSLSLLPLSGFNTYLFVQTFAAGSAGAFLVRRTDKRIDLVRAGAQLALVQFVVVVALSAMFGSSLRTSLGNAVWLALNAFFCGTLTLGFLPILEHALNAATIFRLQELSDLNAPALKLLLSVAPGTYSHSVTVAHLAESACREIGASALLARVGAYYHDIGKIEQPEYFIENQSGYNKHDDINPRLSATVLRSHVKFGLERAESLGLPAPVRDIIAEHHGNSIIGYFFAQAQKEDSETSSEDYRYPGPLPGSRESAVVLLADCVEAASRTLKKPTVAKLEQFVKEMITAKTEGGQLARSELTFHDLEQIKNTFVRILASHFHSRIEYPRLKEASK